MGRTVSKRLLKSRIADNPKLELGSDDLHILRMSVSVGEFIRDFARFRAEAQSGKTVLIQSGEGEHFIFEHVGASHRPRQVAAPLSEEVTKNRKVEEPAFFEGEWQINQ